MPLLRQDRHDPVRQMLILVGQRLAGRPLGHIVNELPHHVAVGSGLETVLLPLRSGA